MFKASFFKRSSKLRNTCDTICSEVGDPPMRSWHFYNLRDPRRVTCIRIPMELENQWLYFLIENGIASTKFGFNYIFGRSWQIYIVILKWRKCQSFGVHKTSNNILFDIKQMGTIFLSKMYRHIDMKLKKLKKSY